MKKHFIFLLIITTFITCGFWQSQAAEPTTKTNPLLTKDAIVIEAESTVQKDTGVEIIKKDGASGGEAVICRPAAKAFYDVNLPSAGEWRVWVRMFCPNSDSDSYWIGMDDATPFPADNAKNGDIAIRFYAGPGDSVNNADSHMIWYWDAGQAYNDPKSYFTVSKAGKHRLWIKGRENGTIMDTIIFTKDKDFNPEVTLKGGPITAVNSPVESKPTPVAIVNPANRPKNNEEMFLWNGIVPGMENVKLIETWKDRSNNPNKPNRIVYGITKPSIIPFFPEKSNGIAVLIMPGGGYKNLSFDRNGVDVAKWLNTLGITGFVLKNRLWEGYANEENAPLQDAQRALRIIRKNAAKWGLNPAKIGVMGFSAGGHLASCLGNKFNCKIYNPTDAIDAENARPDFVTLVYPGIRQNALDVTKDTPQTFMVLGDSDMEVPPIYCAKYYEALHQAKVPVELHIFENVAHGFSVDASGALSNWLTLWRDWMNEHGMFK